VASAVAGLIPDAMWRVCGLLHDIADRLILPLGFVALATGVVVYGGIFVRFDIFFCVSWQFMCLSIPRFRTCWCCNVPTRSRTPARLLYSYLATKSAVLRSPDF
jgi:hypothetical protein